MKAVVCTRYGSPDVMQLRDVLKPVPKPNEVLVKIHTATVTAGDCEIRKFHIPVLFWLPLRIILGITKPRIGILGQEYAGEVEAVGDKVSGLHKGDSVFGATTIRLGAYAQYITLPESYVNRFPLEKMTYEVAVTIPTGGINGLHFVRMSKIKVGVKVLINGAGGSIGTYAVQFAKSRGPEVTCVDSVNKLPMLRVLGADAVVDYMQKDFTRDGKTYDVIIDIVGNSSFSRSVKSLNPKGRYVLGNPTLAGMLRGFFTSLTSNKKIISRFADYKKEAFDFISKEMVNGKLKSVIDRRFTLDQLPEAHRYVDAGLKAGNVIILIDHPQ